MNKLINLVKIIFNTLVGNKPYIVAGVNNISGKVTITGYYHTFAEAKAVADSYAATQYSVYCQTEDDSCNKY